MKIINLFHDFLGQNMCTNFNSISNFPFQPLSQVSTTAVSLCLSACQLEGICCFYLLLLFLQHFYSSSYSLHRYPRYPTFSRYQLLHTHPPPTTPYLHICLYPSVLLKSHNLQFSYSPSLSYIRCGHILPSQLKSWLNSPTTTSPSKTSL